MQRNKIEFKYLMNLWKALPGYPTKNDVVYEINAYLVRDGRPNGNFSNQTFNSIYGSDWENTEIGKVISELFQNGTIQKDESKSKPGKDWYKIINNKYYN